jgi:thioester reductase-like protein
MSTGTAASVQAEPSRRAAALMLADAVLPVDVRPTGPVCERPRIALVTGATGFLGRYAVRALLQETDLRLICLVRAADGGQARARLLEALAHVGISQRAWLDRVDAVCGDVAMAALGLDAHGFAALAGAVDTVYHCAAEVNWARSYRQLRAVNVHGALEVLRFACAVRAKPLLFVSTIAVCFAEGHSGVVDEDADMLDNVAAMPLGYAQSKCVAESLLRQASQRGLPVTILRPALISGDSVSGDVNLDDLIAALVEGCAAAGAAIDVDWLLDCVPVDFVAAVLARLPTAPRAGLSVLHLIHDQARHWREVVLWMNLYGCPVKLLPRDDWLQAAFTHRAVAGTRLYGYRRFFQGYRAGENTPRPFEAFLEPHQRRIVSCRTARLLEAIGVAVPPLDAPLLRRYFERYRIAGLLPADTTRRDAAPTETLVAADFERLLRQRTGVRVLRIVAAQPLRFASVNGILNEISSVRLGARVGIRRYALTVERLRGSAALRFDMLVKTKATDTVLTTLSAEIAALCDAQLGALFDEHRDALGVTGSHERELALYELRDPRLRRHTPRCFGTLRNTPPGLWTVALEYVREVEGDDVSAGLNAWSAARLDAVVNGLASIQSVSGNSLEPISATGSLLQERSTAQMLVAAPLWRALGAYASTLFSDWSAAYALRHEHLTESLADWWPRLLALPHTLIHNDFNPRNVVLRCTTDGLRLCAFDWELAGIGLPQRDLAEFLCFVAGERAAEAEFVAALVEQHRRALSAAAGVTLDPAQWRAGFVLALRQFLVTRLPMYALIHRFRPQRFLPRVVRGAMQLHETTETWLPTPH